MEGDLLRIHDQTKALSDLNWSRSNRWLRSNRLSLRIGNSGAAGMLAVPPTCYAISQHFRFNHLRAWPPAVIIPARLPKLLARPKTHVLGSEGTIESLKKNAPTSAATPYSRSWDAHNCADKYW
jgi:hypothetical protein